MLYYYTIDYVNPKVGNDKDYIITSKNKLGRRAYRECVKAYCGRAHRKLTKCYSIVNIPNRKERKQIIQETSIIVSAVSVEEFDKLPLELLLKECKYY